MSFSSAKTIASVCLLTFTTGCITDDQKAAQKAGEANAAVQIVEEAKKVALSPDRSLPALPKDCRKHEKAGLFESDTQQQIIFKYDSAVTRGNKRIDRCSEFYDSVSASRKAEKK